MTNQPEPRKINADLYLNLLEQHDQLNRNLTSLIENSLEPAYCLVILNPVNGEPHAYWNTSSPVPADYILGRGLELLRAVAGNQATQRTPTPRQEYTERRTSNQEPSSGIPDISTGSSEGIDERPEYGEATTEEPISLVEPAEFTGSGADFLNAILEGRD